MFCPDKLATNDEEARDLGTERKGARKTGLSAALGVWKEVCV